VSLLLRPAQTTDCHPTHRWHVDPTVRAVSRIKAPLDYPDHCRWFWGILDDPTVRVSILELDGEPIGMVRVDCLEMSWVVDAEHRGKGYGTEMVRLALLLEGPHVYAVIGDGNAASRRVAEKAGVEVRRLVD